MPDEQSVHVRRPVQIQTETSSAFGAGLGAGRGNGQDQSYTRREFAFNGALILDEDPLKIGDRNYADLHNLRYTDQGLEGVQGYSTLTQEALSKPFLRSGIQFEKRINGVVQSHVLVQAEANDGTAPAVYQHLAAIPQPGSFTVPRLLTDSSGSGLGRFALGPDQTVVYCNGVDAVVWGSAEHRVAAVLNVDQAGGTFVYDISTRLTNILTTPAQRFTLVPATGGGSTRWLLIGSTRPLQGIKFYVYTANTAAATSAVSYWNGAIWSAVTDLVDGTAVGGVTLAQTGTMRFLSTADVAHVKLEEGYLLYFYRVEIGATGTPSAPITLYHCTVDAPMQPIIDIWDGVERTPIYVTVGDLDFTFEALQESNLGSETPIAVQVGEISVGDDLVIGFEERMTAIRFQMFDDDLNSGPSALTLEYWNGAEYTAVSVTDGTAVNDPFVGPAVFTGTGLSDATSGGSYTGDEPAVFVVSIVGTGTPNTFQWAKNGAVGATGVAMTGAAQMLADGVTITFAATTGHTLGDRWTISTGISLGRTGLIHWDAPPATLEFPQTISGLSGYFYRLSWSGNISDDTNIDLVTGIPAQRWNASNPIIGYRFPVFYNNRVLLVGQTASGEGNRIDYSATGSPDVWNGEDASDKGKEVYIGDGQDLIAGIELSNRFSGTIQRMAVLGKYSQTWIFLGASPDDFQHFQISATIGMPAPLTLVTADVSFSVAQDAVRTVAMWVSHKGPVLFDGGVLTPMSFAQPDSAVSSIDPYFDPNDARYVTIDAIANARGWFDATWGEYNIVLPINGSTTCNVWLACDMKRRKWFKKVPTLYPQMAVPVSDTNGGQYIYGGLDTGHLVRLEHGPTWRGAPIAHLVETAEMAPTGSSWDQTRLRYLKVMARREEGAADLLHIHYAQDGSQSFTPIATLPLAAGTPPRWVKTTDSLNQAAWGHTLRFTVETTDKARAPQLIGWGLLFGVERLDL